MTNKVTVIGSMNLDTTLRIEQMPRAGETLHTKEQFSSGGGKGANQAVAASRSQADVSFIGAVGQDQAGQTLLELFAQDNIDSTNVKVINEQTTGQAYILVESSGENRILITKGANYSLDAAYISQHPEMIAHSDFVLAQLESNIDATLAAFEIARKNQVKTILNPAPAVKQLPKRLFQLTDLLIPNETEAEILTGMAVDQSEKLNEAANALQDMGVGSVIITLGNKGVFYTHEANQRLIPAVKVKAIDTTAAGDTFIGTLSAVLKPDFTNIETAIQYACQAAALTVQRFGAQSSIPYQTEIVEANN